MSENTWEPWEHLQYNEHFHEFMEEKSWPKEVTIFHLSRLFAFFLSHFFLDDFKNFYYLISKP